MWWSILSGIGMTLLVFIALAIVAALTWPTENLKPRPRKQKRKRRFYHADGLAVEAESQVQADVVARAWRSGNAVFGHVDEDGNAVIEEVPTDDD